MENDGDLERFAAFSIASFRISDSEIYTRDFSPDAALEVDANTVLLYNINEGEGFTLEDESGSAYDGTIEDGTWDCWGDREMEWEDGSTSTYTYWGDGEPNDAGKEEDCVVIRELDDVGGPATWIDLTCSEARRYSCSIR